MITIDSETYYQYKEQQYWLNRNKERTPQEEQLFIDINKAIEIYENNKKR